MCVLFGGIQRVCGHGGHTLALIRMPACIVAKHWGVVVGLYGSLVFWENDVLVCTACAIKHLLLRQGRAIQNAGLF